MSDTDKLDDARKRTTQVPYDLVGKSFGQYLILRKLGTGGMADVYLAWQESLDRQVAIKVLKPNLSTDQSYVLRLHNEAKSVAALVHPHIVQIYEVGHCDAHHFIAQEYVPGVNLKQRLTKMPGLPVREVIRILLAITSALEKSESLRITHRDIKPENILLGDDGAVKVADFGLARKEPEQPSRKLDLTQVGMTVGTPLYMSPEQIRGTSISPLSDMYSLGVTAYHMLAGHPPFDAESPLDIAMKHVQDAAEPMRAHRPDVPASLEALIAKMMQKLPQDRFASFPELRAALLAVDASSSDAAPAPTSSGLSGVWYRYRSVVNGLARRHSAKSLRRLVWLSVLAALVGSALAYVVQSGDPLALRPGEIRPEVEKRTSAQAQYVYAMLINTEQAWKSVFEYFPAEIGDAGGRERYYALSAKMQLARWYLDHDRPRDALVICEELARLGTTETGFVAFGLAGQVIAYYRLGEEEQARTVLGTLVDKQDDLDSHTREEIDRIFSALSRMGT